MANYSQELAQDAVCKSHTGHMTGLWFLPARPVRLNTNERMKGNSSGRRKDNIKCFCRAGFFRCNYNISSIYILDDWYKEYER
jgi:hypothetical protein